MFEKIYSSSQVNTDNTNTKEEVRLSLPFLKRLRFLFSNKIVLVSTLKTEILNDAVQVTFWIEVKEEG